MRPIASLLFSVVTLVAALTSPAARAASDALPTALPSTAAAAAKEWIVYVGAYTAGTSTSKGIQTLRLNRDTGELTGLALAVETQNPSFLAMHPNGRMLYAVNEVGQFDGKPGGGVTAFTIGKGGALTKINEQNSGGGGPAHISLNKEGTHAFVANYGGGSVSASIRSRRTAACSRRPASSSMKAPAPIRSGRTGRTRTRSTSIRRASSRSPRTSDSTSCSSTSSTR